MKIAGRHVMVINLLNQITNHPSNWDYGGPSRLRDNSNSDVDEFEENNDELMIIVSNEFVWDDGALMNSTNDFEVAGRNERRGVIGYRKIARNYSERSSNQIHVLKRPTICPHCEATLFQRESSQICCLGGKLRLPRYTSPPEMLELFSAQTQEGRHFKQYIRVYNNAFAFTSMGVHYDESLAGGGGGGGVYTFRAHGAIYHRIGSLIPISQTRCRYAQSYILDTEHEVENRLLESDVLQRTLVVKIQCILQRYNPFVSVLRQLGQRQDLPTCKLVIKCQQPNMHQYSLPTTSQVAAVIVDEDEMENINLRDIIVQTTGGNLINIPDIAGYYDPLQYVLMLPYGSYGWDVNTKNINGDSVTCRAFYSNMLQIRPNDTSLLLRGGRLLQQYVVDTYVKIETHKLRWIKDHQQTIRADLYKGLQDYFSIGENDADLTSYQDY